MASKHKNKIKKIISLPSKKKNKGIKSPPKQVKATRQLRQNTIKTQSIEDLNQIIERFGIATKAAQLGIWDWDIPKNILVWDDMMYKLFMESRKKVFQMYTKLGLTVSIRTTGATAIWNRSVLCVERKNTIRIFV